MSLHSAWTGGADEIARRVRRAVEAASLALHRAASHEFDANSRDTLIVLREGYGREAPDWDANLESRFEWQRLQVKLANATGGDHHKVLAQLSARSSWSSSEATNASSISACARDAPARCRSPAGEHTQAVLVALRDGLAADSATDPTVRETKR